jgi:hypothetical protein
MPDYFAGLMAAWVLLNLAFLAAATLRAIRD